MDRTRASKTVIQIDSMFHYIFYFGQNKIVWKAVISLIVILFSAFAIWAKRSALTNGHLDFQNNYLLNFTITNGITEDIERIIHSGINTEFNFFIKVYEVRKHWWDKNITSLAVSHKINYDNLKNVYMVKFSENNNKTMTFKSFDKSKKRVSEIRELAINELCDLQKGKLYQIRIMAELEKIKTPTPLFLLFFSPWKLKTDWYTLNFVYW
ncbi:DUF4390 domain-containing protein [Thermodesulfobacteriota bacterium]